MVDAKIIADTTEADWEIEYFSMNLAVCAVADVDETIGHICRCSSGHTEGIVTSGVAVVCAFQPGIDVAIIAVSASTCFTDGGQLGPGAEVGASTQELHTCSPMGLAELTTTAWTHEGEGTIHPWTHRITMRSRPPMSPRSKRPLRSQRG